MMLWPRTLLGRTALIIASALILSQVAAFQLFNLYFHGPRFEQLAALVTSHLRTIAAALQTLPAEEREAFLDSIEETQGIRVIADSGNKLRSQNPSNPGLEQFARYVRQQLGAETQFFAQESGRALWIKVPLGDGDYWISIPRGEIERPVPWVWIAWTAVSAIVALGLAYLMVRRMNRPLRELAAAAAAIGKGERPQPISEMGPAEVRGLGATFNRMTSELDAVERERALLLAGISHDLRTPLARLRLGLEMTPQTDAALKASMEQDIEDMDAIVQQFLDFAREGSEERSTKMDLNQLIRETCANYATRGKRVESSLLPLPELNLRPLALKRLLTNLIDNAFRYGAEPVAVSTALENDSVVLRVLDRGPGVPEAERERLLRPFTRRDQARGDQGGSGLGLAIVERVARMHGGAVELLARAGGGLEVRVSLPVQS